MVLRFCVTSSPISPSPRVAPRTSLPSSYTSEIASPSTFGSVTYSMARSSISRLASRLRTRCSQARSSSSSRAFASDSIGSRCCTSPKRCSGRPPTRCVGESAVPQLRVLLLQAAQLAQQVVVVRVRDLRVVLDVVAVVVVLDLAPQVRGAGGRIAGALRLRHQEEAAVLSPIRLDRSQPSSSSMLPESVRSKWSGVTEIVSASIAAKSVPSSEW